MTAQRFAALFIGSLTLAYWVLGCQGQNAPLPGSQVETPRPPKRGPAVVAASEYAFPALKWGPATLEQAPSPELRTILANQLLPMSLMSARSTTQLVLGFPTEEPSQVAPYTFVWPLNDLGAAMPATWTMKETSKVGTITWSIDSLVFEQPHTVVQTGLSNEQRTRLGQPKVNNPLDLVSPVYAAGTDERARSKQWHAIERKGAQGLQPEQVRRLEFGVQLGRALNSLVHTSHRFPDTLEDLSEYGVGLINVVPTSEVTSADVTCSWDGVQAYLIQIRLSETAVHERVLFFESLGMEPDPAATPIPIGETGATMLPSGERTSISPRFPFDAQVGRTFQPIGAWNLVPAESATIPLTAASSTS